MRWLLLTLITLQAATCGQSGRLTLPEDSSVVPAPQAGFAQLPPAARQAPR